MTVKFYHHKLKKHGVHVLFWITSGEQISNNYAPCFKKIDFDVIHSYIKLCWSYRNRLNDTYLYSTGSWCLNDCHRSNPIEMDIGEWAKFSQIYKNLHNLTYLRLKMTFDLQVGLLYLLKFIKYCGSYGQ